MKKRALKLGSEARCMVTGFVGILTARVEYLNGCVQYALRPKVDEDGKHQEAEYMDEEQVEVIGPGVTKVFAKKPSGPAAKKPGGPQRDEPPA